MSFFYLTPVRGDIQVHLLETIINNRLDYLKAVLKEETYIYNEYVVEGSIYDNVGHFMVCILTILSENWGFTQFLLKAELELFKRRINSLNSYDMRSFAKKLIRSIKKLDYTPPFTEPLRIMCRFLMLKDLAQHICTSNHNPYCTAHNVSLHFKYCLQFISRRQVELRNGQALLPCSKWKQYLCNLFTSNLKNRLKTNVTQLNSDPRIKEMLNKMKQNFPAVRSNCNTILSKDVDEISKLFPPCMLNLHLYLRRKHRLSHTQRFYYSLFLKDIGMPVEEAVEFWRMEYRQNANSHACTHNWERDEKKYLYGIRHMYGLEGCKKNYASVSCMKIQSSDTACSEGGCPFKSFDSNNMSQILNKNSNLTESTSTQINELKRKGQYTSACIMYLEKHLNTNCDNNSYNFTPVKYFLTASKSKC